MPHNAFPEAINRLRLFSGISEEKRNILLQAGKLRYLGQGEFLFHYGDPIRHFYIVCSGGMQLVRETPEGKAVTADLKHSGQTIGKVDILKPLSTHHHAGARAISEAVVLEFPASWLKEVAKIPIIALNILSTLSQHAHMVEVESEQKSTMSTAQRVGCFMQRLCVMHELDPRRFELPYSKALIASRLGMEPETLSRALHALKEHGIRIRGSQVSFSDITAIEKFVCEHCSLLGHCATHQTFCSASV